MAHPFRERTEPLDSPREHFPDTDLLFREQEDAHDSATSVLDLSIETLSVLNSIKFADMSQLDLDQAHDDIDQEPVGTLSHHSPHPHKSRSSVVLYDPNTGNFKDDVNLAARSNCNRQHQLDLELQGLDCLHISKPEELSSPAEYCSSDDAESDGREDASSQHPDSPMMLNDFLSTPLFSPILCTSPHYIDMATPLFTLGSPAMKEGSAESKPVMNLSEKFWRDPADSPTLSLSDRDPFPRSSPVLPDAVSYRRHNEQDFAPIADRGTPPTETEASSTENSANTA